MKQPCAHAPRVIERERAARANPTIGGKVARKQQTFPRSHARINWPAPQVRCHAWMRLIRSLRSLPERTDPISGNSPSRRHAAHRLRHLAVTTSQSAPRLTGYGIETVTRARQRVVRQCSMADRFEVIGRRIAPSREDFRPMLIAQVTESIADTECAIAKQCSHPCGVATSHTADQELARLRAELMNRIVRSESRRSLVRDHGNP